MTKYLITGAARGIGFELVKTLLPLDTTELVIAAVRSKSDQLVELEQNPKLKIVLLDVSDEESVKRVAEELKDTKVNVLINNAGINPSYSAINDTTVDELLTVFRTNTIGPIVTTRNFVPLLEATDDKPAIIANISSILGSVELTDAGAAAAYKISKAAVNMVNKLTAVEYKDKVAVSIHPGWVQTDMGGANAHITPQQSVQGILQLLSNIQLSDNGKFFDYQGAQLAY